MQSSFSWMFILCKIACLEFIVVSELKNRPCSLTRISTILLEIALDALLLVSAFDATPAVVSVNVFVSNSFL